ncbi:uncharacterized protein LOC132200863 [Neocloeon triangulifer]|uniref:uncharacterized protein LOC132200863 n=1 Tax=Neocloeon triangulifer TaxID=2078957 RepID=UPI00286FA5B0|nr:uncharacterized protein LOC132200863 [Neocloeon triangulifer]XP_059482612.1 uncharacterized protein LOC132200863 [Neocloeon triangulifer]
MVNVPAPDAFVPVAKVTGPFPLQGITLPAWQNCNLMSQALKDHIKVHSITVEEAVAAGENYGSTVSQIKLDTNLGPISLFVKTLPQTEGAKFLTEFGIFKKEINMYTKTLPLIRSTFHKPNFPICIYHELNGTTDTLILKNLTTEGYRTRARRLGLDLDHCRLALSELAHLHGHSIAIRIKEPEKFNECIAQEYADTMYEESKRSVTAPFWENSLRGIGEAICQQLPSRYRELGELTRDLVAKKSFEIAQKYILMPTDPEELSKAKLCLNHGDFWSNNMLFKYDNEEKPIACSMVDFQISRCASPVLDLLYFLFTSTNQALRRAHMFDLLEHYLREGKRALALRGVTDPPPSYFYSSVDELHKDILRAKACGFLFACVVLPIVIADESQVPTEEEIGEFGNMLNDPDANPFAKMYSGPAFCSRMKELLDDFDDMGFFAECKKGLF